MTITEALESRRPLFKEMFINRVNAGMARLVADYGVTMTEANNGFKSVYNSPDYSFFANTIRPLTETYVVDETLTGIDAIRATKGYRLVDAKVEAAAVEFAQDSIDNWLAKINSKIGMLSDVTVRDYNHCRFDLSGTVKGLTVRIEQDMIINCSCKGLLFNQYPARIYVNFKFTSEAKFKKLMATL